MSLKRAYVFILAAAALWGCIAIFFKMLSAAGFSPMQSVAIRVTVSLIVFFAYIALRHPADLKIKLRHIPYFIGTGIISLVFFNYCYFNCINQSSIAVAAVLLYTAPIFVTLISAVVFKDRLTPKIIAALIITFIGCAFVTGALDGGGAGISWRAIVLGLCSGLGYALYTIFGKFALRHYSSNTVTLYTFAFAAAASIPMACFGQRSPIVISGRVVLASLAIAVLCCVLPYIFYTRGLESVPPGKASIMATLEPVVAALLGTVIFQESMTLTRVAGLILVVGAIVLLNTEKKNAGSVQSEIEHARPVNNKFTGG